MGTLHRLVYCSQTNDQAVATVTEILKQSRANNQKLRIAGILLCYEGSYIQVLEGERDSLINLYANKIAKDRRHKYVVELISQKISERIFADWSMECCFLDRTAKFKGIENEAWHGLMSISPHSTLSEVERVLSPFRGSEILTTL